MRGWQDAWAGKRQQSCSIPLWAFEEFVSGKAMSEIPNLTLHQSSHSFATRFMASLPKQKHSHMKSRQLRRLDGKRSEGLLDWIPVEWIPLDLNPVLRSSPNTYHLKMITKQQESIVVAYNSYRLHSRAAEFLDDSFISNNQACICFYAHNAVTSLLKFLLYCEMFSGSSRRSCWRWWWTW